MQIYAMNLYKSTHNSAQFDIRTVHVSWMVWVTDELRNVQNNNNNNNVCKRTWVPESIRLSTRGKWFKWDSISNTVQWNSAM